MVNESLIGVWGPDFDMTIEAGKVREFAHAVYARHPHSLRAREPVIPATFLTTAGIRWGYTLERPRGTLFERLDHDLSVPLHAEEAYRFHGGPPRGGSHLTARACLDGVRVKQGSRGGELTFLVLLTEFYNDARQLVAEARSTTVTTQHSPDGDAWAVDVPHYAPVYDEQVCVDPFTSIHTQTARQLAVGKGPGAISMAPLTLKDIVVYVGAGGEANPLHYDETHARAQGYPAPFAVGMHQAGALSSYASAWLGPGNVRSFNARFDDVVWVGEALSYAGTVSDLRHQGDEVWVDVVLECKRDNGQTVTRVWMTFALPA